MHIIYIYKHLVFFGFQVCTNGIVCLGQYTTSYTARPFPLSSGNITAYTSSPFSLNNEDMGLIAPYWADADPSKGGTVWSRVSTDVELLNNVSSLGE